MGRLLYERIRLPKFVGLDHHHGSDYRDVEGDVFMSHRVQSHSVEFDDRFSFSKILSRRRNDTVSPCVRFCVKSVIVHNYQREILD